MSQQMQAETRDELPRRRWAWAALLLALTALAACGTRGYAPALGATVTLTLPPSAPAQPAITATFAPTYAVRIAAYLHGQPVSASDARTPLQLRQDTCAGPVVAALNVAARQLAAADPAAAPRTPAPEQLANADGSVSVALAPGTRWWVVLLDSPAPGAAVVACGHAISDRRQYFDLFPPAVGNNGVAIGTALADPLVATRVDLALQAPAPSVLTWSVRTGDCAGQTVSSGSVPAAATSATGTIFAPLDTTRWWLAVGAGADPARCQRVAAG